LFLLNSRLVICNKWGENEAAVPAELLAQAEIPTRAFELLGSPFAT
jgi:hypothetical protein